MTLQALKTAISGGVLALGLSGCTEPLPGGETGPFAPGNEVTFYYQGVLTDPPETARIVPCEDGVFQRACIQLSNGASLILQPTETGGVFYGNEREQVVLMLDPGGVPSGVGQYVNAETSERRGFRWISLPRRGALPVQAPAAQS